MDFKQEKSTKDMKQQTEMSSYAECEQRAKNSSHVTSNATLTK